MTFQQAEMKLNEFILKMEQGEDITYAAIIKDPNKSDNYWFEYGTYFNLFKSEYHLEKDFNPFEIKKTIAKRSKIKFLRQVDKYNNNYGNFTHSNLLHLDHKKCKFKPIQDKVRPIKAALGISDYSSVHKTGTLGAFFLSKNSHNVYLISNMHVMAKSSIGADIHTAVRHQEKVVQPSRLNANTLRLPLTKNPFAKTVWKAFNSCMDVAVAKVYKKFESQIATGFFNQEKTINSNYFGEDIFEVKDFYKSYINRSTYKIGYKTGYTKGKLFSINAAINVRNFYYNVNGGETDKPIIFKDQIMTSSMAEEGDSGSILNYNDETPIGLTFADIKFHIPNDQQGKIPQGRTFHNRLYRVFQELEKGENYNGNSYPLKFKKFLT